MAPKAKPFSASSSRFLAVAAGNDSSDSSSRPPTDPFSTTFPRRQPIASTRKGKGRALQDKRGGKKRAVTVAGGRKAPSEVQVISDTDEEELEQEGERQHRRRQRFSPASGDRSSPSGSSSDGENGGGGQVHGGEKLPPSAFDWWDPRQLPPNSRRRKKQYHQLEYATYNSALHDAVADRRDFGKVLYAWEKVKKRREETQEQRDEEAEMHEDWMGTTTEMDVTGRPTLEPLDPFDNIVPTAIELSQMARWPIPSDKLPHSSVGISDELVALVSTHDTRIGRLTGRDRPRRKMKTQLRSAYEMQAPLARPMDPAALEAQARRLRSGSLEGSYEAGSPTPDYMSSPFPEVDGPNADEDEDPVAEKEVEWNEESGDSDSSLFEDSDALTSGLDDVDLQDRAPAFQQALARVASTLNGTLAGLAEQVPVGAFPARDLWQSKKRVHASRQGKALGWEYVLALAEKDQSIPEHITTLLRQRLEAIYGAIATTPSLVSRGETNPPPFPSNYDFIRPLTPLFPQLEPKLVSHLQRSRAKPPEDRPSATPAGSDAEVEVVELHPIQRERRMQNRRREDEKALRAEARRASRAVSAADEKLAKAHNAARAEHRAEHPSKRGRPPKKPKFIPQSLDSPKSPATTPKSTSPPAPVRVRPSLGRKRLPPRTLRRPTEEPHVRVLRSSAKPEPAAAE